MGGREIGSSESMYATTHVSSDTACWRHWEWSYTRMYTERVTGWIIVITV